MELEIKKKSKRKLQTLTGFISFIIGLLALTVLNIGLLIETVDIPELFLFPLPFLGVFLGVIGVFTKNRSKQFAWWGIGVNVFIPIFFVLMMGLSWTINAKP
ncbi:hypothetical protein P4V41_13325 [Fictibacillus nanhaiensis]|uniref:hypothetical protein n=1 Tax=Fictibacillus nanhaiensis TaxID=742169 RepID=UPI002E233B39|nr:hypothetical protein [Fictibacillus nanhaiensis]